MRCSVILLLAVLTLHGVAQTSASDSAATMRLRECIDLALEHSPSLRISEAREAAAVAKASEVRTQLLPQLKATARAAKLSTVDEFKFGPVVIFPSITENYSARLTLQQPLFTGFRLLRSDEAASLGADAAHADQQRDRADLIMQVTAGYWNLVRAIQVESTITNSIGQMREHLKDINNLLAQGMATDLDLQKAKVQLASLQVQQIQAGNAIDVGAMQVNSLMGTPLDRPIRPGADPAGQTDSFSPDSLLMRQLSELNGEALKRRPEVRATELRREAGVAGVGAARAGWFPSIMLTANYDYARPNQRIVPPKDRWDNTWDVGVNVQWNIWDWMATKHQTAQAEAAVRQTEATLMQVQDAVLLDVTQSYYNVQAARKLVDVAQDGVATANETFRISDAKYKQGVASNTDVLDAQTAMVQAQITMTQARVDLAMAAARLKRALGLVE